jgi:hypothetical protein
VPVPAAGDFTPTQDDLDGVQAWFTEYDEHVAARDVERMAEMAMFPLNEVTDGQAESCSRERFVAQMTEQLSGSAAGFSMESTRTPHFLNENLVFVITDATMTMAGHSQRVRYGDLLVKCAGQWKFQTMVQGGWAES